MSLNETGMTVITIGALVMALGALLLFDPALIIIGNLLIIGGIILLFRSRTFNLFKLDKIQGMLFFIVGVVALLFRYSIFGILLECIGLFLLFKNSIPDFRSIIYKMLFRKLNKKD